MPELDMINDNLEALAQHNQDFQALSVLRDRRLSQEICQDLSALSDTLKQIQEVRQCANGVCSLGAWKPAR